MTICSPWVKSGDELGQEAQRMEARLFFAVNGLAAEVFLNDLSLRFA